MARAETFRGYGPETGYDFLVELDRRARLRARAACKLGADEIFVSDGGKQDTGNIQEIFAPDCRRRAHGSRLPGLRRQQRDGGTLGRGRRAAAATPASCTCRARRRTGSSRALPDRHVDLIYLCYPNNPTGAVLTAPTL